MARWLCTDPKPSPSRRALLGGAAASLALWSLAPKRALALGRDPRLLVVVLRGGLDGISMLAPVGDPDYAGLRGALAVPAEGAGAGKRLDQLFVLNRNMPFVAELFDKRQALGLHAVATPYRARSHFDGQDVLESGLAGVGRVEDGWLNRALADLPGSATAVERKGLAMGAVVPLVMRGKAPVLSWIPDTSGLPLKASTIQRLTDLYAVRDQKLAKAFAEGLAIERVGRAASGIAGGPAAVGVGAQKAVAVQKPFRDLVGTAEAAARFLSAADGPRIGALSFDGWDTHANEGVVEGQLGNRLAGLDTALKALADGLGPAWAETVVVVVTEFGRTAHPNGTGGTDHGTATAALLLGGAVKGGRVIADWPGLSETALYEKRDLKPTMDLRAVLKGVLRDHLGVPAEKLASHVFPDSVGVRPMDGLVG
ncbi:MAG: DUF1501 domain-containing protein [Proteobacteria bacterium]|nr:DUF1501 domain-containing protein [Pseudomonadota bacterium]